MKRTSFLIVTSAWLFAFTACKGQQPDSAQTTVTSMKSEKVEKTEYNPLTQQERNVLVYKATDRPFTGEYYQKTDKGVYICRMCNNPLYHSEDKFESHCGWPSFDDEIKGAVKRVPDADGYRIEIICNNCGGHLGHVFEGERFTDKNVRHCVNTSSIKFIPAAEAHKLPPVIVLKK
ncbi:MAG TPA: methionine-R-sulfoxide reductase [Flavobacteriales bacterium]|nr:methionine-R-sulfoxide reductase [Flavobacteriales bacterium]